MTTLRVVTIGGYGYDERSFVQALLDAGVDLFVDIRQRRGVRGARYAFLNSSRLQAILGQAGIRYLHALELAPTTGVREAQKRADAAAHILKRDRTHLAPAFVEAYRAAVLATFNPSTFREKLGSARTIALFCVEAQPLACHRSIAAEFLRDQLGTTVEHLRA